LGKEGKVNKPAPIQYRARERYIAENHPFPSALGGIKNERGEKKKTLSMEILLRGGGGDRSHRGPTIRRGVAGRMGNLGNYGGKIKLYGGRSRNVWCKLKPRTVGR